MKEALQEMLPNHEHVGAQVQGAARSRARSGGASAGARRRAWLTRTRLPAGPWVIVTPPEASSTSIERTPAKLACSVVVWRASSSTSASAPQSDHHDAAGAASTASARRRPRLVRWGTGGGAGGRHRRGGVGVGRVGAAVGISDSEVGQDGEHAAVVLVGLRQAELQEDVAHVLLDRAAR